MNQEQLLALIWGDETTLLESEAQHSKGIAIYKRNQLANAQLALSVTFPTIFTLLDNDVTEHLVKGFLQYQPPSKGDWSQWGDKFSEYLAKMDISQQYPYLPDCAALDWKVHCAFHGKDELLNKSSLPLLGEIDPDAITITFNSNCSLLKTDYPVAEIYQAHHHSDKKQREMAMEKAKNMLSKQPKQHVVMVYRPEFQPKVIELTQSESEFMQSAIAGKSLSQSIDAVSQPKDFSFEQWLLIAIEQNLIYHFNEKIL